MPKTEHREREHHPRSPSNFPKWELCPAFVNRLGTSDAAERGTQRHEVFEANLAMRNERLGFDAHNYTEVTPKLEIAELDEAGAFSIDYINSVVGSSFVFVETKAEYKDMYFGYVDAWASVKGHLHVFDLKTGWGSDPDHLAQQEGYCLALLDMAKESTLPVGGDGDGQFPDVEQTLEDTDTATLHLIWEDQRRTYRWETTYSLSKALVMEIIAKRLAPDPTPRANKNCQYCQNLTSCEAVNHELVEVVRAGLPTNFTSPEDLAKANQLRDLFNAWGKKIHEITIAHIADGGELPGFSYAKVKGKEKAPHIKDAWAMCRDALTEMCGSEAKAKDKMLEACSLSPSKFRALFKGEDFPAQSIMRRGEPYYRLITKKRTIK